MKISDLKENDMIESDWFVNWPILICKYQSDTNILRVIPLQFLKNYSEVECNRRMMAPVVRVLEKSKWKLVGQYKEQDFLEEEKINKCSCGAIGRRA